MKFTAIVLFIWCIALKGYAQFITGKVYKDNTNGVPVAHASVYYSGSTLGTTTHADGSFSLPYNTKTRMPIVVSSIGYNTITISRYSPAKAVEVYLKVHEVELEAAVVVAKRKRKKVAKFMRGEMERIFKREFLGTSDFARSCVITNLNELEFYYEGSNSLVAAYCKNPLNIINPKLGYTIKYFLDSFKFTVQGRNLSVKFEGNFLFQEMEGVDKTEIDFNRQKAYSGSRMEMIRGLWNSNLYTHTKFKIFSYDYKQLAEDSLVVIGIDSSKYIHNRKALIITNPGYHFVGKLLSGADYAYIGANGFYMADLIWDGPISLQRVGDLLPYEYQAPSQSQLKKVSEIAKKPDR
jgi:hypothetical protein